MNTSPIQPHFWETLQRFLPIVLTLMIGIILSVSIFTVVQHWEKERVTIEFNKAAEDRVLAIQRALDFNLDLLQTFDAFFQANQNHFTHHTFETLADHFLNRYSFIQAIQWVPRISAQQRQQYEARRQLMLADFKITEVESETQLIPAGERPYYFPLDEIKPLTGNGRALGFDLASHPKIKDALALAEDEGKMRVIPHTTIVEYTNLHGLIVVMPVYQKTSKKLTTVEARRQALSGFIIGIYQLGEILDEEVMHYLEPRPIDVRLFRLNTDEQSRFIYFYPGKIMGDMLSQLNSEPQPQDDENGLHFVKSFSIGGLDLKVVCTPAPNYFTTVGLSFQGIMVLVLGLLITILLAGYFHISMRHAYHLAEAAEEANYAQSQFLASMSHQMRTPITAITGYSELLLEEARTLEDSELKQDIEKVYISTRYLLSLSEGILDLAKIKSGRIDLRHDTCEVSGLIRDIEDIATPLVQKNHNQLVLSCADNVGAMNTDVMRIHQILLNIINHVAEHTHEDKIHFTVDRAALEGFEWIRFAISGNMRLSYAERESLQLKLRRAETSTSDEQAGLRMGLVISAHLWHMLDGRISVKLEGDNTMFILYFPALP